MGFLTPSAEKREASEAKAEARWEAEFWASPTGQARLAYERGDLVFQLAMPLREQNSVIVKMATAAARSTDLDWSAVLNEVVREGWEVVAFDATFIHMGSQSRDKFMSSGQQLAVHGGVIGYYLFKRSDENYVAEED